MDKMIPIVNNMFGSDQDNVKCVFAEHLVLKQQDMKHSIVVFKIYGNYWIAVKEDSCIDSKYKLRSVLTGKFEFGILKELDSKSFHFGELFVNFKEAYFFETDIEFYKWASKTSELEK